MDELRTYRLVTCLAASALLVALTLQVVSRCGQCVPLVVSISDDRFAFSVVRRLVRRSHAGEVQIRAGKEEADGEESSEHRGDHAELYRARAAELEFLHQISAKEGSAASRWDCN